MTPDATDFDPEAALGRSFSIVLPIRSREVITARVNAAIATETMRRASRVGSHRVRMPARRLLLGVAAAMLLTGTIAVAGGSLFSQLIHGAPLLENVWDRATQIGQSRTDAGYTIVLQRAAADRERVWVALSVTATSGAEADIGRLRVVDANGVVMGGGTGAGTGDVRGVSASLTGLIVPDGITPHGPFTLEVTSVTTAAGETPGHWTFSFDVPLTDPFSPGPAKATARP